MRAEGLVDVLIPRGGDALKKSLAERQAPAKKPPVRAVEPAATAGPVAVPKRGKKAVG